jgi:cytoskeleton protein RodZ
MSNNQANLVLLRQSRGLSLEQIAAATKISLRYLKAIEEGRLAILPGGVYTANYLRQYAEAIHCAAGSPG